MVALMMAIPIAASGCWDDESDEPGSSDISLGPVTTSEDPGPIHIHGLGINPADGALYAASHTGLFRLPQGGERPERVADRYQDTMAFTIVGPDRFLGSGHPDGRENLPPFLGLIESTNAGETWEEVSLMGEVDFHLLVATGEQIYGFGSEWEGQESLFLASTDGGRTWDRRPGPTPLIGLAISPRDPRELIASTPVGLHRSADGGGRWQPLPGSPGLLTWPRSDQLLLADAGGTVSVSDDEGRSWEEVGRLPDEPVALDSGGGKLLAAMHDGTVLESNDGSSWDVRFEPSGLAE